MRIGHGVLLLALLWLGACGQADPGEQIAAAPSATATVTALPPVVVADAATATALPSFVLPTPAPTATATPLSSATPLPTATSVISDTEGGTATPTPGPTFTRPAPPEETGEHFWFRRPVGEGGVVWTDKYYPYGSTRGGQLRVHHGVEFNVPYNTPILAVAPGTVRVAGSDAETAYGPHTNFYGNLVVVQHDFQIGGQALYTLYGHLNEVSVVEGQRVETWDVLGLSGATGVADGPHMHMEVRVGANSYDNTRNPLLWLYPFPDRGVIAGRVSWPNGAPVEGATVSLNRVDGSSPYQATTTYAGSSVNADGVLWTENFALDDVYAGYYEVIVTDGSKKYTAETWVYPYRTSFVEIVLP